MLSSLKKMRGDKRGWYKVSDLVEGLEVAVPSKEGELIWDEIVSIRPVGREHVYDIEVDGTHNFVGNGIFAHNTYMLRASTTLAVTGEVHANSFISPFGDVAGAEAASGIGTTTLMAEIPSAVLTADGLGVDLYKLATYNLTAGNALAARMDAEEVRVTSLETRVEALESGAVSSASGSPITFSTSSLASALEGFGVLIRNGIAQFNTLVFRQLVASRDADGTSSAGSVTIIGGNTIAQVTNSLVMPSTKVFVTFNSSVIGSWWVSDKTNGSFRVVLSEPQSGDVSFDYFLVQTEGQIATSTPTVSSGSSSSSGGLDTTAPIITLLGDNPLHLSVGGSFVEPGVTVTDNVDASVPYITFVNGIEMEASAGSIDTSVQTTYIITYSATDTRGNLATATRSVIIGSATAPGDTGSTPPVSADTTAPVVTLTGEAAMQLTVGDTFTDPGATATDDTDGDITSSITVSGAVDTATEGFYTLTYTATDAAGNTGSVSRVVTVVAAAAPAPAPAPEPAPAI